MQRDEIIELRTYAEHMWTLPEILYCRDTFVQEYGLTRAEKRGYDRNEEDMVWWYERV